MRPDVDTMTDAEVRAELRRRGVRPVAGADHEQEWGSGDLGGDGDGGGNSLLGLYLIDYETSFYGRLLTQRQALQFASRGDQFGTTSNASILFQLQREPLWLLADDGSFSRITRGVVDGSDRLHTLNAAGESVGARTLSQNERDALYGGGATSASSGGGSTASYAPVAYSSTRQAELDRQAFEEDQARQAREYQEQEAERNRAFEREEAEKARYNQERMSALGNITQLASDAGEIRQQARDLRAQVLGTDQFRAAAFAAGGPTMGRTPVAAFRNELRPAATAQTPTIDYAAPLDALRRQQGNLRRFVDTGLPQSPPIGMAKGGVIDMKKGKGGKFATVGGAGAQGFSVLVGEGPQGEGVAAGTAEVMTVKDDRIEITPFVGGAQQGGTFYPQNTPSPSSLSQAFAPLLGAVGFNEMPVYTRNALKGMSGPYSAQGYGQGVPRSRTGQSAEFLQRLGVQPRLMRDPVSGTTFYANNEGELFTIGTGMQGGLEGLNRFGFGDARDVVSLTPQEIQEFGFSAAGGGAIPAPLRTGDVPQIGMGGESSFGAFPAPIMLPVAYDQSGEPTSYIPLPDPANADFMARFRRMDETTQNLVLQGYDLANFGADRALGRQRFFTPTGSASAAGSARLG